MNRKEVRKREFAMLREWAEKHTSEELKKMLAEKSIGAGNATAAREVLRARGEPE